VRQPIQEKGRLAAELLVAALAGAAAAERHVLPTELILRETTR
jgi:DNA-binding LacI/PurR family transcriptional regulator